MTEFKHISPYTVAEIAALMGLSRRTITRLFDGEPGVIVLDRPETLNKRRYRSLRVPRHVYERVLKRLTQ
jgi:transcriptional regulator GlxA family with amidase domain